ncbi:DEAD (Asp-Glu-Ala-Asp) box polypeptide 58 [Ceratobasidium sp. AG-Ba]|nr:DEAD (Asp-Glu-Ala-Asp) box polypeptide 58 [Ceratobasidium sp. AG-Ba]
MDPRKPIDLNLPTAVPCSMREWIQNWTRFHKSNDMQARDRFGLTGHYLEANGERLRARLSFENNRVLPGTLVTQVTDVDSMIAVVKDHFPFKEHTKLEYFPLYSPKHALDSDLHLPRVMIQDKHGEPLSLHPHQVPSARFLEANRNMLVRIHFPRLERGSGASKCLNQKEHEQLYDLAFRPAAEEVVDFELNGTWPARYADELFRAEDVRSQREAGEHITDGGRGRRVQQSALAVHSKDLDEWIARVREIVDNQPELAWARSFFFVIQMRGLKHDPESMHMPPTEPPVFAAVRSDGTLKPDDPRVKSVEHTLGDFLTKDFDEDSCFVDLGMNIRLPPEFGDDSFSCPLPAADAHLAILCHVLGLESDDLSEYMSGKGGYYQRDDLAGLKTVAGFRFRVPGKFNHHITYIQLYTSDKTLIYNLNLPHHAKRVTCSDVLFGWKKWRKNHFEPLLGAFKAAAESHVMYLRLEVRVRLNCYPFVQLRVPDAMIRSWIYTVESDTFWAWKYCRLTSLYSVLCLWMDARRSITEAELIKYCSLFVTLIWMANSLVNRPDDGGRWDEVRDSSSVHNWSDDGSYVAVWPLLAHFLHSLKFETGRPPKMSGYRSLSMKAILFACSKATEMDLHRAVVSSSSSDGIAGEDEIPNETVQEARRTYSTAGANRRRKVQMHSEIRLADLFPGAIPEPAVAADDSEGDDPEERPRPITRTQQLTDILCDLPCQMFQKAPVCTATKTSWSVITPSMAAKRPRIFEELATLEVGFPNRYVFENNWTLWENTVNSLLPTIAESLGDKQKGQQGLSCLAARSAFLDLQKKIPDAYREEVVRLVRKYVNDH